MYQYEKVDCDKNLPMKLFNFYFEKETFEMNKHWHNSLEIIVPVVGSLNLWIDHEELILSPGDIYIVNSKVVHQIYWIEDTKYYKGYCLQINYGFIKQCCKDIDNIFFKQPKNKETIEIIRKMIEQIIKAYEVHTNYVPLYIESNLLMLLYVLCDKLAVRKKRIVNTKSDKYKKRITEIVDYMQLHYKENISLDMIANHFDISSRYFTSIFKQQLGVTPKEYLTEYRLKQASIDLLETDSSATDIAYNHGFPNLNSFYVSFKREFGKTPNEYRRLSKESLN